MKSLLMLGLLLTGSAIADSFLTGSSDVVEKIDPQFSEGSFYTGASEIKTDGREIASDKKKPDLSVGDDAFFTGSSY